MTDLLRQLHGYGEQLEARMGVLEVEDVRFLRVGAGPVRAIVDREPPHRRRRVIAAAAGVAALAAVALAVLLWPGGGEPAPVVDEGTTVPTTVASTSTTTAGTPAALAFGLDGLAAFRSGPVPAEAACPPGSTPDTPGDPTAPRPPVALDEWGTSAAFDRESGLLVLSVEGSTWTFDPCWNRWEEMGSEGPVLRGGSMVYDADSDLIVASDPEGGVWGYDVDSDTWRPAGRVISAVPLLYHDPSGLVIFSRGQAAWGYDIATDTLESLGVSLPPTDSRSPIVTYDPLGNHFYAYTTYSASTPEAALAGSTWRYDPGQGWEEIAGDLPAQVWFPADVWFSSGDLNWGGEHAFDEAAGRMVVFSAGTLVALDPAASAWEILYRYQHPLDGYGYTFGAHLVYDSANDRLIVLGGHYPRVGGNPVPATEMWAFDTRTAEWVKLLPAEDSVVHSQSLPEFPSLADSPDTSLHGTVAYFASTYDETTQTRSGCVRAVAAEGMPTREYPSLCVRDEGLTGPQLAFLPDGRLQVTMFRWPTGQPLVVAWQKILDLITGDVEEVPADQLPEAPFALDPGVGPAGETISASVEGGHAQIVLTDVAGNARVLMSATVGPEYQIRATWGAGGDWVLADDGRLLIVTLDDPAVTRVLVADHGGVGGIDSTDPPLVSFAVTDVDFFDLMG